MYDSVHMKYPRQTNPERQSKVREEEREKWLPRARTEVGGDS